MANESLKIFISHSSHDHETALALINLVKAALNLKPSEIRCTSIDGYRLPIGSDTDERLREEVLAAEAFIGIISPESVASAYVLFELGGRWGAKRSLAPLLAPGVKPDILKGPIAGLNVLSCSSESQLHQLVDDIAHEIGVPVNSPAAYLAELKAVSLASRGKPKAQVVTSNHEDRGLFEPKAEHIEAIAAFTSMNGEASALDIANKSGWSLVKARHFVDDLMDMKLIESSNYVQGGHLAFHLTRKGRAIAVENDLA
jgi:hypothetical protein